MANKQNHGADVNEALVKSEAFVTKNKKPLLIIIIALLVIIGGAFAYKGLIESPRNEKASTLLGKGQEYFNQEQFDIALNGDKIGYIGFLPIANDYSSTHARHLAKLYAGLCYANLGKWQDAKDYLEKYSTSDDAMVSPAATAALGDAYEDEERESFGAVHETYLFAGFRETGGETGAARRIRAEGFEHHEGHGRRT